MFVPGTSGTESKMAVMVWIHGTGSASFSSSPKFRGFSIGSSTENPAHVLAGYNNVIVVTFNYRLGILGFLSRKRERKRKRKREIEQPAQLKDVIGSQQHQSHNMWIKSLLFDLNYNLLIGASLLAVAKSIYYVYRLLELIPGLILSA